MARYKPPPLEHQVFSRTEKVFPFLPRAQTGTYSVSMDARGKGGKVIENLLEALAHKAMTPAEYMRKTFETMADFPSGVDTLAEGDLIDEIYYVRHLLSRNVALN